jgi:hypothetical protein
MSSLVDFLSRLVDVAVSPSRLSLPESPPDPRTGDDRERCVIEAPTLSLETIQWEHLRVDRTLIAFISTTAAKVAQLEQAAIDTSALYRSSLAKANELEEESKRLRHHGERLERHESSTVLAFNCFAVSEADAIIARLRQSISESDASHKLAVDAMQSQHMTNVNALRKQLKEVCSDLRLKRRCLIHPHLRSCTMPTCSLFKNHNL